MASGGGLPCLDGDACDKLMGRLKLEATEAEAAQHMGESKLYTLNSAPYTLNPTRDTIQPTQYTLHKITYTLHPTTYNLHPTTFKT